MKKLAVLFVASAGLYLAACHSASQKSDTDVQEVSVVSDSVIICSGRLVMGHESYAFVPDGDTLAYWVVDRSGDLKKRYETALPAEAEPYTPVSAKLKVKMLGPSSEGFAADYDGVVEVQEIISVGE